MTWCHCLGLLELEVLWAEVLISDVCVLGVVNALCAGSWQVRFDLIMGIGKSGEWVSNDCSIWIERRCSNFHFSSNDRCLWVWGQTRDESDSSNVWERHLELVYEKSSISEPEHSVLLTRANTSCVTSVNDTLSILRRERIHHLGTTFNGVPVNRDSIVPPLAFQVSY
jgi:hypothetical protein